MEETQDPVPSGQQTTVVGHSTTLGGPIIQEVHSQSTNDRENSPTKVYTVKQQTPNPEPDDIHEKIKLLKDFLGNQVDDEVIKVALRDENWITERAMDRLFDEDSVNRYKKEVEEMKQHQQQQVRTNDGSRGNP